jgi:hypothetical protein
MPGHLQALLAQTNLNPFWHEDTPNHDLDYQLWHAGKVRHHKQHFATSLTAPPPQQGAPPPPQQGAPPPAPAADNKETKGDGDSEGGEMLEYTADNGKVIMLSGKDEDSCISSCQNAPELKDEQEGQGKASMAMNMASGGEQAMVSGCIRFCQTEFEITCFPENATVVEKSRGRIPMSELCTGDQVLIMYRTAAWYRTGQASDWALRFEPVITWLDHMPDVENKVVQVCHKSGEVSMSPDHMIFARRAEDECAVGIVASDISVGDRVMVPWIDGSLVESEVTSVSIQLARGKYAPLTPSGTLLVDSTAVSCYALPQDLKSSPTYAAILNGVKGVMRRECGHEVAHSMLFPARLFHQTAAQCMLQLGEKQSKLVSKSDSRAKSGVQDDATVETSLEDHVHPYGLFLYVLCKSSIIA